MKEDDEVEGSGGGVGPAALLDAARRRFLLGAIVGLAVLAVFAALAKSLPDIYRSSATILIERQQIPDELVRSTVTGEIDTRLRMISQEILSRSRLEGLVQRFNLYPEMQRRKVPMERIIERMRDHDIAIDLRGGERRGDRATVAFAVAYRGRDPRTVALVANTLASYYIEENLRVRERQAAGTAEFLRVQLDAMKKRLEEQEKQVSEFKERHIGELPQQLQANLSTVEQLNGQLRLNSDNQIKLAERRALIAEQLAAAEGAGPTTAPEARAARLAQLSRELAALRTRFSEQYPDVVRVKAEIASLEKQTPGAATEGGGENAPQSPQVLQLRLALSALDAEMRVLQAEAAGLRESIARYQRRVENAPRREQEFQSLSRDYETTQEGYRSLLVRQREAELAESMEQRQKGEQFRILDPAIASEEPAAPNRRKLLILGIVAALLAALGSMFVAEVADASFHTVEALRHGLALPVMGTIPLIESPAEARRRRMRSVVFSAMGLVGVVVAAGLAFYVGRGNEQLAGMILR